MRRRLVILGMIALALVAGRTARGQEAEPEPPRQSWIIEDDQEGPGAPLWRAEIALLGWIDVRSRVQASRGNLQGTDLDNLEEDQGLDQMGAAVWAELSIGDRVRGGADISHFLRNGEPTRQEESINFDGVHLSGSGDYVEPRLELLIVSTFLQWDALYGETYRIGLIGGLRYFRFEFDLEAIRSSPPARDVVRTRGELISPFFGGHVILTPFPYLSVITRIQFMNWSWEAVNLKESRYLEFRLGIVLNLAPRRVSLGVEYRFLLLRVAGTNDQSRDIEGGFAANGFAISIHVTF